MAVTHITAVRNVLADAVVDRIDQGSANATGKVAILESSGPTLLAELDFQNPAFGAAAGGTATANAIDDDTSANNSGTADVGELRDRDDAVQVNCSVGATSSGEDIELSSVAITSGDTVSLSSMVYNAAP